jgi:hypothetical protein
MTQHEGQNFSLQLARCGAMKFHLNTSSRSIPIYPCKNIFSAFDPHQENIPLGRAMPPWIKQKTRVPRTVTHAQACQLMTARQGRTGGLNWSQLTWEEVMTASAVQNTPPRSFVMVYGTHGRRRIDWKLLPPARSGEGKKLEIRRNNSEH